MYPPCETYTGACESLPPGPTASTVAPTPRPAPLAKTGADYPLGWIAVLIILGILVVAAVNLYLRKTDRKAIGQ